MPLTSKRQQRYMFANHPRIAKRMADAMRKGSIKQLPKTAKKR